MTELQTQAELLLTSEAIAHFASLIEKEESGMNLRLFVANVGTPHADISITFCPKGEQDATDRAMPYDSFTLFVAEDSLEALREAVIDFKEEEAGAKLSIKAPYLKGEQLNEDASLEDRIQNVLDVEINPNLAMHGGSVALESLIDESIVILRFSGGCQGCSMSTVTLKNGIERVLKEKFPEIVEIRDVTDHNEGDNPYC